MIAAIFTFKNGNKREFTVDNEAELRALTHLLGKNGELKQINAETQ